MSSHAQTPDVQLTTDAPLFAARYLLFEKLGEGGMGAVFRARDVKLDRAVALKMLLDGTAPNADALARFQREAKALARLAHPGIIQAYDSGEEGGRPFLVMELVNGRSLAALLREQGHVSPARAADFAYQAALALDHAHQSGLIHRDVKPSNLLLPADGRLRLLDLGLARFLQDQIGEAHLTQTGQGMGTPDYAPPEQFRDAHKADVRSDVYSLGCTLYHLIAGRVPFPGSSFSEKVEAHETKEPAPLEELCPEVPAGLALTVRRMMAKRPTDRFQSMAEVAEALMPHVAGSSASFPHIRNSATWDGSRLATMPAYPRRPRRILALAGAGAALVLLLLVVGLVGLASGWFRQAEPQVAQNPDTQPADTGKQKPADEPEPVKPVDDPNVLTVSQKAEGGGTYRTIGEALEAVKAGQTIRVLDDGVYHETLTFKGPSLHAGVTLEALRGAVLERDIAGGVVLSFHGVPHVTVRGFRLRAKNGLRTTLVSIRGECAGLRLESLELLSDGEQSTNGIELFGSDNARADQEPVVIQGCTFRRLGVAAILAGATTDPVSNVALRDGLFEECFIGVRISSRAARLQIVGNRFRGLPIAATQFQSLTPDSADLLIANNTFTDCAAFRLWDSTVKGKGVRLQNNLLLDCQSPDMRFLKADNPSTAIGPGDGTAVAKAYDLGHNWREGREPTGPLARAWIPPDPKKGDIFVEKIEGVNRDPRSPDYLRPDAKSKLATEGAGKDDPSLPCYVGALPPVGTNSWDWEHTWRTRLKK